MLDDVYQKNDELLVEFSGKHREIVLGETQFKLEQLEIQADAYRRAGVDEVALAQWVAQEKLNLSEDWKDGAIRGWKNYAEEAGNAAKGVESLVGTTMHGLEDMVGDFFETGKIGWRDFVNTVNAEIGRLAFKQLSSQAYDWLGSALNLGMSAASSYFGGSSISSAAGSAGVAGTMSSLMSRSAHGNVFYGPGISEFSNTVVTQPTTFWANGGNLMGEDGPEAIMPLKRMSNNDLGVKVSGGFSAEVTVLLRELVTATRAQRGTKVVNAIGKGAIANELSGSDGERVIFNHIRRNPGAVRRMLGLS
jgi:lambda family phage tail tape measure protein